MIYIVANTKGGVGKTTFSQHFLLPALRKAVYIDTDTYNSSISNIKASKFLEKAEKIRAIDVSDDKETADLVELFNKFADVIENNSNHNIIIDTGAGSTASAVLRTMLSAYSDSVFVFVPVMSDDANNKKTIDFIASMTSNYSVVNIINNVYDNALFIPDISATFFGLAKKYAITLPEIGEIEGQDIRERGLINMYKSLVSKKVEKVIDDIRKITR